jgi:hypothetical protein
MKQYAHGSRPWRDNRDIRFGHSISYYAVKRMLGGEPVAPST